ncbi:glycosyltransferase family 4 protein [Microscilla marina]|uniref:Glycosyl transferases group 1 n=1 Tax=Microscilla marina ATCC 23134 TaxID=313606 RepID=A1ZKR4_MICM2|nr:glycosyltransferase family 4 protein [Microscilla marina]EAY28880.1 glycosyl transferases group 1 [Microscilla marina ATCC 23134]
MRIAIVLNSSWNIYNFRRGLIEAFLKEGHTVLAIAPTDKYSEYLQNIGCEFHPVALEKKGSNPLKDLKYMRRLYNTYKKTQPDVVLQFTIKPNIYGTLAASMLNIPVVNNVCGLGTVFLRKQRLSSKVARMLYKFSFRFPKKVFFQNQDDLSLFIAEKYINPRLTDLVPGSGIPLDKFKAGDFNRNNQFTFLLIARLIYDKGILEYIEAVKLLRAQGIDARFQLLGAIEEDANLGVPKKQLDTWIAEGLVEYLGVSDNVQEMIVKADCVVLPSYREGTPRVLLEAASMSKPLIATNVPGCKQTIDNGVNGFLCRLQDAEDFAEKMKKMTLLNDEELMLMGEESRKKAEREFDEKLVVQKYMDTIRHFGNSKKIVLN